MNTDETSAGSELKSCFICGGDVTIQQSEITDLWSVSCIKHPGWLGHFYRHDRREELIKEWNNAWSHKRIAELEASIETGIGLQEKMDSLKSQLESEKARNAELNQELQKLALWNLNRNADLEMRNAELEKQSETARQEFAKEIKSQSELYERQLKVYREALKFYADPETYFAIGFFPDRPCGEFMSDFSKCADSVRPGKRARIAFSIGGSK